MEIDVIRNGSCLVHVCRETTVRYIYRPIMNEVRYCAVQSFSILKAIDLGIPTLRDITSKLG